MIGPARDAPRPSVAFGPVSPGWGSWDWVGADIGRALRPDFATVTFEAWELPDSDAVVLVKHAPPPGWADAVRRRSALVYAPVDRYASAAEIDADAPLLRRCARVLVHAERLLRYVRPYAPAEYIDHHVKFVAPLRQEYPTRGDLLWVGVHSNLPPLIEWVNAHPLPAPLRVLTNGPGPWPADPAAFGFSPDREVAVREWTPELQVATTARARGFLDIKGPDFRARHKPPAKGIDAIASGLPLAMNPESGTVEHLARMGFDVCPPEDHDRWLSREYAEETRRFGAALRELLSLERVARRHRRILEHVLDARTPGLE